MKKYSQIFLVKDRNRWEDCKELCITETDLVLVLDFGLFHLLNNAGYHVQYLDCIVESKKLDALNLEMHHFLQNWFIDSHGNMLFNYQGFSIGDALLLNIINNVTYFCHFAIQFIELKEIEHEELFVALDEDLLNILEKVAIPFTIIQTKQIKNYGSYWFPISEWMNSNIKPSGFKFWIKYYFRRILDITCVMIDLVSKKSEKLIYIHRYYPTELLIDYFSNLKSHTIINETYGRNFSLRNQRRIYFKKSGDYSQASKKFLEEFDLADKYVWNIKQVPISQFLYEIIKKQVAPELNQAIRNIHCITNYFKNRRLDLMIPVSNLALENRLIMQYCFLNQIPVFTVLNGLQIIPFWFDAKDSNWVNCYGKAIKEDYYQNATNALSLGDPRMDIYCKKKKKIVNREKPVIIIGTSGYNPLDLNSYLAVEFDFINTILSVLKQFKLAGKIFSIVIKVRANGFIHSYKQLIEEYFPEMDITLEQTAAFISIIEKADLYISFYSQTIFEASLLGIPSIYFKNDRQTLNRPFDGNSELVTARTADELQSKILSFFEGGKEFDSFLEFSTMEKYIGPLDGQSKKRNIDFIHSILN